MAKIKSNVPFNGTPEQEQKLNEIIAQHKNEKGALMPIMQKAQDIYGYLPVEVQIIIAEALNVPLSEVYGVSTFYSQFALVPKGENVISVCTGTACYVRGAKLIVEAVGKELGIGLGKTTADGKYTFQETRCLGCCGLAPVMVVNGEVHGRLVASDIKRIISAIK
ncbi:MAG: NADH-quinone oxidoreductase subunit NuoE [Oscillospiraceae bacterium]|nr:NADH-quinone oxidoreductase subunit NuoE [Oscillospiraceae bacterium]